jgi:hypothetical protein
MTAPTTYQQWETASIRVDQSLALAKILRELFWNWENEHALGTAYCICALVPVDLRLVADMLTRELTQASDDLSHMEPIEEVRS